MFVIFLEGITLRKTKNDNIVPII